MKLFLDCDLDYCDKSKAFVAETLDSRHRQARSQQGSRRNERRDGN